MILDEKTIAVLSNFQTINQSIVIRPGNRIRTMSQSEAILAQATVPNTFDSDVYIYDLSKFLALLSLAKENEVIIGEHDLTINQGKSKVKYRMADPILFKKIPENDVVFKDPEVEFALSWDVLANAIKAMQILKFTELAFIGDGEKLYVSAVSTKDPDANTYATEVGETTKVFECIMEIEKLKLVASDYYVRITSKGIVHFKGETIEYYIAMHNKSKFEA